MLNKFLKSKIFPIIIFVCLAYPLFLVAWWIWYPYDIINFKKYCYNDNQIVDLCDNKKGFEGIIMNPDKKVIRGHFLDIQVDYIKKMNIQSSMISRYLINDNYIMLISSISGLLPVGKHKKQISIFIPPNVIPGKYHLSNVFMYRPNPLREIIGYWESEEFEVLE